MDSSTRIYIEFTSDLKDELDHRVSLQEALEEAGIQAEVAWGAVPPTAPDQRGKALAEMVTAGAIAAVSLAAAVKILLSAIDAHLDRKAVRDTRYEYWVSEPLLDGKGKPIPDAQGRPLLVRKRLGGFDAIPAGPAESLTITVGKGLGVGAQSGEPAGAPPKTKTAPD